MSDELPVSGIGYGGVSYEVYKHPLPSRKSWFLFRHEDGVNSIEAVARFKTQVEAERFRDWLIGFADLAAAGRVVFAERTEL